MKAQLRTVPATRTRKEWSPTKAFLPLILGKELDEELTGEELSKLELFEKGLANELSSEDTIEMAVGKIVRMALAAEFGATLVAAKGARAMADNITRTVLAEPSLRKQALIIIDRFAHV